MTLTYNEEQSLEIASISGPQQHQGEKTGSGPQNLGGPTMPTAYTGALRGTLFLPCAAVHHMERRDNNTQTQSLNQKMKTNLTVWEQRGNRCKTIFIF